jgi:predicted membrane protein
MAFDPVLNASPSQPWPPPSDRHLRHRHRHRGRGIIPGLVLIVWGELLFLREIGVLDRSLRVMDFWPLILIGLGLAILLSRRRHFGSVLVGLAVTLLGASLLAQRLGYGLGVAHLWPILFVVAGIAVIWKGFTRRHVHEFADEQVSADELQRSVSMGGLALVVDSQRFRGGSLSVTMGEIRADLRRAALAAEEATLDLSVTMGGIELYVPSNWQVMNDVSPFMGTVEDKTDPRPDAAGVQRRIILRGKVTMGAVTIKN